MAQKNSSVKVSFWEKNSGMLLGLTATALAIALLFARVVFSEILWATVAILIALAAVMGLLIHHNHRALRSRSAAYGLNSVVTIALVFGLLAVGNFLALRYPKKVDLTRNQVNTLSDQTTKLVKGLKQPLHATLFDKAASREKYRTLLDNYKGLSPKFEVEYVDPDREPTRAKAANIKKYGTLLLTFSGRDVQVEEPTEEKLTNALIKLSKDKSPTFCAIVGHGEKNFSSTEADGYDAVRKGLINQSYVVKDVNLIQESNKIPPLCDAIAIMGPTKSFFDTEVAAIRDYLANGGRAVIALDISIQGVSNAPELLPVVNTWNVKLVDAIVVDPVSRVFNVDPSMPIVSGFSRTSPITKDFAATVPAIFPLSRPLDVVSTTPDLTTDVLGKASAESFAVTDFKTLAKGEARFTPGKDRKGPFNEAITIEGKLKDSKAPRNTRLVVFGTSHFATNQFARYGVNLDFFLNSVSWIMEDESMISIRSKEDGPGKIDMSQRTASVIQLVTVILVPLLIAIAGVVIWIFRRRL